MSETGAVILAAGLARRMGKQKQLLPLENKTLFRYAVDAALEAELKPVIVVGGRSFSDMQQQLEGVPDVTVIYNEDYESGMASSLKKGISAIEGKVNSAFVFLADQPFVQLPVLREMMSALQEETMYVQPVYKGRTGHPVLLKAELFPSFMKLSGDQGGKKVLQKFAGQSRRLSFEESAWGMDIDTPEDLEQAKEWMRLQRTEAEKEQKKVGGNDGRD